MLQGSGRRRGNSGDPDRAAEEDADDLQYEINHHDDDDYELNKDVDNSAAEGTCRKWWCSSSSSSSSSTWRRILSVLVMRDESVVVSRSSSSLWRNANRRQHGLVIHPDDWWYVLWTHFILAWAVYSSFFTPLEFGFFRGLTGDLFLLDIAGQFAFLVDIVIRFFVAYRDSHSHNIVCDRSKIALRYLKSRFVVDLLGCLPWDIIYKAVGSKELVRYMLWIRLSRALRVTEFFEKMEKDIRINYQFTRIVKLLAVELYCTHTAACIFYYLATTMPPSQEGYTWIGSLQMGDFKYSNFREIDLWKRYITSLYFAIVTMATVGYGEIHAVNVREMIFIMVYVSFDMILGAYLLGNMTALIVKGSRTERFRDKMTDLIRYMNKYKLGKQVRDEVKEHLRLQYSHKYTEATVLQDIPINIRKKIQQKLYEPDIRKVALFKGCSSGFIKQIAVRVHEELFLPGEMIIEQETTVDQLYILCNGELKGVRFEDDNKEEFPLHLPNYSTLGDVSIFLNTTLPYTVEAFSLSRLLRVDKQSFVDILETQFSDGRTILDNLLEGKDSNLRKKLLESDITLYIVKHESELAMRVNCATFDGDFYRLRRLLEAGADPKLTDYNGRSPLHVAASRGYEEIVTFLIDKGVAVNDPDNLGNTPLLEAIKNGHDQVASALVKAGALLAMDDTGNFLCTVVASKNQDLLKRLFAYGIDPNAKNYDHRTPLHVAVAEGLFSMAALLVEAGASVLPKDRWGNTPVDEARLNGNKNLIMLLKGAMNSSSSPSEVVGHWEGKVEKCTVFPFHPWDGKHEKRAGVVLWVPRTVEELIVAAKEQLGISTGSTCLLLTENGGKIMEVGMISDDQNLFLVTD